MIKKASKRLFILVNYKRNGVPTQNLRSVYMSTIRSVLEYTSNVYHSQINKGQINMLERLQKRCLKILYGYSHSYEELLKLSGLETLEIRLQKSFEKFAKKT